MSAQKLAPSRTAIISGTPAILTTDTKGNSVLVFEGSATSEILVNSSSTSAAPSSVKAKMTSNPINSNTARGLGFTQNPAASGTKASGADAVNACPLAKVGIMLAVLSLAV